MPHLRGPMRGDADGDYDRIRLLVRRGRGVDLGHYKRSYVQRRLLARLRARRRADLAAYARLLAAEPEEVGRLVAALSTKVTSFFRNPGLYAFLERRVLPEILRAPPGRTVRLWSAACATGEEAYSLAALVASREPPPAQGAVRIVGTDVDRQAIAAARRAEYPLSALRSVPAEIQRRCFTVRAPDAICRPAAPLLALATFRVESLLVPPAAGGFDLILCRNVLIYFDNDLQHQVLLHLAAGLRPGGYMALGRVERITGPARAAFEMVHVKERVYRKL